jgi:hypothetical protein
MKRFFAILTALILSAAILSGCSSAAPDPRSASDNSFAYETQPAMTMATAAYGYSGEAYMNDSYANEAVYDGAAAAGAPQAEPIAGEIARKLIRNANITVKTLDADKSYDALTAKITELRGYVYTSVVEENEFDHTITVTYKMPPENLQIFCDWAADSETVTSAHITANDVTTSYYDSVIRLDTLRRSLDKYYEYLAEAETVEIMMTMQNQIDYITSQIESYEGQIRVWDALTAESEVVVNIIETPEPTRPEPEEIRWDDLSWDNVGTLMSNGFNSTVYGLLAIVQWILIALVTISPILVIIALIVVLLVINSKKKKKAKIAAADEKTAEAKETAVNESPAKSTLDIDITITDETAANNLSPYPIEEEEQKNDD